MKRILLLALMISAGWLAGQEIRPVKGDLNNDQAVNATDMVRLGNYLAGNLTRLLSAGDIYAVDSFVGVLRYVPPGTFTQGSPSTESCRSSDEDQFSHTLTRHLAVMETEVTRQSWQNLKHFAYAYIPDDPSDNDVSAYPQHPVQQISWYEAALFANVLSSQSGLERCYYVDVILTDPLDLNDLPPAASGYPTVYCKWTANGYRLPTEGEWEYFCRAGTTTPFWTNETNYSSANCSSPSVLNMYQQLEAAAWFAANTATNYFCTQAGTKAANPWNLRDVHGNVYEWCWDRYGTYPTTPVNDYPGYAGTGDDYRVCRGGASPSSAKECRSAYRYSDPPNVIATFIGFRLVRTIFF